MTEIIEHGIGEYDVTEFYLNFLHDLRAELTIIGGYASLITEEEDSAAEPNPDVKSNADYISKSYKKMVESILNVNDLIRIESGIFKFKKEEVDIKKIIKDELLNKTALLQEKQVSVEIDIKDETIMVTADTDSMKKAFSNLLDSSIGFCPMASRIQIVIFKKEQNWYGYLLDNGPGIPIDEVGNLFKPFQVIPTLEYLGQEKIGLKLLIAKRIINLSGGKLYAESSANKGIKLIFELPVKKEIERKKILIIEDNITIAKMWEAKLKKTYAVAIAASGVEGIKKAQMEKPDVVILDVLMPGMDGFETCKQLKQQPDLVNVPVLFLSNIMQEHLKEKAASVGAVDFIHKSTITPADLSNKIEEIMLKYYPEAK